MSTFVLVHGAWRGGWIWRRVRRLLQTAGQEVFTPTLTGLADRLHLAAPSVNLETHINDVANLVRWEELSGIILCGHSYGGCVVSGVADRLPGRIAALVYLDAFLLENGECVDDTLSWRAKRSRLARAKQFGEGWQLPPIPAETFKVNAGDVEWVNRQTTMQSRGCFEQPLLLAGGLAAIPDVSYIFASGWSNSPFRRFYKKAKKRGWRTVTIESGHDVMLDRPQELVRELWQFPRKPRLKPLPRRIGT